MTPMKHSNMTISVDTTLDENGWYTSLATITAKQKLTDGRFRIGERSLKVLDKDPMQSAAKAYSVLMSILQSKDFDVFDGAEFSHGEE